MSRALRYGRSYDPVPAPAKKKRGGKKKISESTEVANTNTLTLTVDIPNPLPSSSNEPAMELAVGVRIGPRAYRELYGRAPPIRRVGWRANNETIVDSRHESDARVNATDAERASVRSADSAPMVNDDRDGAADRAEGPRVTPVTPHRQNTSTGRTEVEGESREIYWTARTSRTVEPVADEEDDNRDEYTTRSEPYVPKSDDNGEGSDDNRTAVLNWYDEVQRAEDGEESELPDLQWFRDHWSRSNYLSASRELTDEQDNGTHRDEDIEVNAFIYEVEDNYVFSDNEYSQVLRDLREEAHGSEPANASVRSQTSGAGPSRRSTRYAYVDLEEVSDADGRANRSTYRRREPDEREEDETNPPRSETDESVVIIGKGKERRTKKERPRPSLGINLDDMRRPDKAKAAKRRASGRFDESRLHQTPPGFRSGGYLERAHGDSPRHRAGGRERSRERSVREKENRQRFQRATDPFGGKERRDEYREPSRQPSSRRSQPPRRNPVPDPDPEPSDSDRGGRGGGRPYRGRRSPDPNSDDEPEGSDPDDDDESDIPRPRRRRERDDDIRLELERLRQENERLKERNKKQAKSGYKAQAPKTFNGEGTPNIDKFEHFVFDYDNWIIEVGLDEESSIRNISRFLDGKASTWYMLNVAPAIEDWTLSQVYQGIYEYCFPADFKEIMRKKYLKKSQGESSVQDYFAELAQLRRRLNEVTDAQHVQRAWDGVANYIRAEWAIKGMLPQNTTIEEMRETALDIERAHKIRQSIENEYGNKHNRKRNRSRSPTRRDDRNSSRYKKYENNKRDYRDNRDNRGDSRSHGQKRADDWKKNKPVNPKAAKTDKQKDEYRAANKCFECSEVGHLAKDCPSKNRAKPSGVRSNAASLKPEAKIRASAAFLKELEELSKTKERIEVSSLAVCAAKPKPGSVTETDRRVIERNAMRVKDAARVVPNTLVVRAEVEGESVRAMIDSGSQADILSTTLVDQLKLPKVVLTKPLQLQLAITGSKGMLQYNVSVRFRYQEIDEMREFDIGNIDNYDVILGTPWMHQHRAMIGLNPCRVQIGSVKSLPIEGENILRISSVAADVFESRLNDLRNMLIEEAESLCKTVSQTPLPPFRAINHVIPLIDRDRIYKFRPSRCPEALKHQFDAKARDYIQTGRWRLATGKNAIPMLFIPKKTKDGSVQLRTVLDKREQNSNTKKLASPLPNIKEILSVVSRYKYKTLLDGKDAYEQIRIEEKDVQNTLFHTPLGTMESLVMQIGDCNAGATYQTLMNHLFAEYIGVFMYVYLDDIIIYSNTIEDHVKHILSQPCTI